MTQACLTAIQHEYRCSLSRIIFGDCFLVSVGMFTPRTEQVCPLFWLWTLCQIAPCQSWPPWGEENGERPQTEGDHSPQRFTKGWKYLTHLTGGFMVHIHNFKYLPNILLAGHPSFLPRLCSCRCCNTSEGPSHLRFLLELCHHWSSRGRSLPEGEKQLALQSLATFQCFQLTELLPYALWSHRCSAWQFIC